MVSSKVYSSFGVNIILPFAIVGRFLHPKSKKQKTQQNDAE
jgi:hypothetical protein